jgi:hypothetical protein
LAEQGSDPVSYIKVGCQSSKYSLQVSQAWHCSSSCFMPEKRRLVIDCFWASAKFWLTRREDCPVTNKKSKKCNT